MTKQDKLLRLTFAELQNTYPNSWVLLSNPVSSGTGSKVESGILLYKNRSKKKVMEKIPDFNKSNEHQSLTVIYTGEVSVPKDTVFCL